MALSNWDTLAIDKTGKSIGDGLRYTGLFYSGTKKTEYKIEIYKNWLYLSVDGKTVGACMEGSISLGDINVHAIRGPKEGIYVVAYVGWDAENALFGIGCYGYDGETWAGIEKTEIQYLKDFIASLVDSEEIPKELANVNFDNASRSNQGVYILQRD